MWLLIAGDPLIQVTTLAGLTVYVNVFKCITLLKNLLTFKSVNILSNQ